MINKTNKAINLKIKGEFKTIQPRDKIEISEVIGLRAGLSKEKVTKKKGNKQTEEEDSKKGEEQTETDDSKNDSKKKE